MLSIGRERTLLKETTDISVVGKMIDELAKEVVDELKRQQLWFKGISVKARYSDFTERIKNRQLNNYTDSVDILTAEGMRLIGSLISDKPARKVGIRVSALGKKGGQKTLS